VGGTGRVDGLMRNALVHWGGLHNVTLYHSEGSEGARTRRAVMAFAEFTADQGLMDLSLSGGVSRWSNNLSWPRMGCFLVSPKWELSYPGLVQKKLLRVCSDHAPILLARGCIQYRKRSFKFETCGLKMRDLWKRLEIGGVLSPSWVLQVLSWLRSLEPLRGRSQGGILRCLAMWGLEIRLGVRSWRSWIVLRKEKGYWRRRGVLATDLEASLLQEEISWR
jgi:hypothetical protein